MDIRINDGKADLMECENLTREELEFILFLMDKGGYWEFRKPAPGVHYVHDKSNFKYKGTLEEIKSELAPPMEHIVVPYTEFRKTIQCDMGYKQFPYGTDDEKIRVRHLDKCEGFYNGKAIVVDYTK
jgi:hypothetical protein